MFIERNFFNLLHSLPSNTPTMRVFKTSYDKTLEKSFGQKILNLEYKRDFAISCGKYEDADKYQNQISELALNYENDRLKKVERQKTISTLEQDLERALKSQDYKQAAVLRDEIKSLRKPLDEEE